MKKTLVLCAALLAMTAATASAQLHLSWDDCNAGVLARTFACNTNSSPIAPGLNGNFLVGSFVSPGLVQLLGEDAFVKVESGVPTLPQWWSFTDFNAVYPACRANTSLATTFGDGIGNGTCLDYFGSLTASGGTDFISHTRDLAEGSTYGLGTNMGMIRMLGAVNVSNATAVAAGEEHFAFTLRIRNDRTVGTPSCSGCTDGVTLTFDHLLLAQPAGVGDPVLTSSAHCDFNGGVTPTATKSWGAIKALYR